MTISYRSKMYKYRQIIKEACEIGDFPKGYSHRSHRTKAVSNRKNLNFKKNKLVEMRVKDLTEDENCFNKM